MTDQSHPAVRAIKRNHQPQPVLSVHFEDGFAVVEMRDKVMRYRLSPELKKELDRYDATDKSDVGSQRTS
jgi:hypothetical protein